MQMVKGTLLLFCCGLGLMLGAQTLPKKFAAIKAGTSEPDLIKQVGMPLKIESFVTVKNQTFDTSKYWRYENDITLVITNHAVDRVEPKWENVLKFIQQKASSQHSEGLKIIKIE